jgi:hypothetical protein
MAAALDGRQPMALLELVRGALEVGDREQDVIDLGR